MYVDGFIIPLPRKNISAYLAMAKKCGKIWKEHGALEYRECIGDDVPKGKRTSFPRSVKLKGNEAVVFSWIVYKIARRARYDHEEGDGRQAHEANDGHEQVALRRQTHDLRRLQDARRHISGWRSFFFLPYKTSSPAKKNAGDECDIRKIRLSENRIMRVRRAYRHGVRTAAQGAYMFLRQLPAQNRQRVFLQFVFRGRRRNRCRRIEVMARTVGFRTLERSALLPDLRQHGIQQTGGVAGDHRGSGWLLWRSCVSEA
jgi:uncharacterized protein YbaA (DUF1428 family)